MGNLKPFFVLWFICMVLCDNKITASLSTSQPNHNTSNNNNSLCFLNVIPLQYEINIDLLEKRKDHMSGWLKLKAKILENTCKLTNQNNKGMFLRFNRRNCILDLESLQFSKVVTEEKEHSITIKTHYDENSEKSLDVPSHYILQLDESEINIGDQIIFNIKYKVPLRRGRPQESWQGLYFFDSQDIENSDSWQDSIVHAKYIFPIFDYSDQFHKPTFKISVTHQNSNEFLVISNTDLVERKENMELGHGRVNDNFRESPPMKLDQVTVLILGGYQNRNICTKSLKINLWAMKSDWEIITNKTSDRTLFEIGRMMDYSQEIFNATKYPLNKIDFVVLPRGSSYDENVQAGNLGIVIATHDHLLSDKGGYLGKFEKNSEAYEFIASQVALQWFRGLTSPINEYNDEAMFGEVLASYVMNWLLNYTTKQWPPYLANFYEMDIPRLLDMMESVFTRETIQYAINQVYLPKLVHNGTFPGNLWQSIEQSIEIHNKTDLLPMNGENDTVSVAEIFNTWLNKMEKFPTIKISEVKNETDSIELYQECRQTVDEINIKWWWVPVNISNGNEHVLIWITPNETSKNSSKIFKNSELIDTINGLIFVNENLTKHYDVEYSEQILKNLNKQLEINYDSIPKDIMRRQFLLDWKHSTWNTIEKVLQLTKHLNKEMDVRVWQHAIQTLGSFECTFLNQPNNFQAYFGGKVNQVLERIGIFPKLEEENNIAGLRKHLLQFSHLYDVPLFIEHANNLLTQWMENATVNPFYENLEPEIRGAFYCAGIANSLNNLAFKFLYEHLVNINLPEGDLEFKREHDETWKETKQLCIALTCTEDDDLLKSLLSNDSKLATQHHEYLRICYRQIIPYGILSRRPLTMRNAVYDFWKRFNVNENHTPINETEETQIVIEWTSQRKFPSEDIQKEFVEQYFELSPRTLFTPGFYFTRNRSLSLVPAKYNVKFNEICKRSENWFANELNPFDLEMDCFY